MSRSSSSEREKEFPGTAEPVSSRETASGVPLSGWERGRSEERIRGLGFSLPFLSSSSGGSPSPTRISQRDGMIS